MLNCPNKPVWPIKCQPQFKHNRIWILLVLSFIPLIFWDLVAVELPNISLLILCILNCCRVNVTASCRASWALVSWIGSQRGGGGTMSLLPRASSDSCCAPPCCESGLTGLRGHLHWMRCNAENVGIGSYSTASWRKNQGARRAVYLGQIWILHTLMHT